MKKSLVTQGITIYQLLEVLNQNKTASNTNIRENFIMTINYNNVTVNHAIKGSKIDYISVDSNKILLPYNSVDLLTDTAEIIAAIITEANTAQTLSHDTTDPSTTAHSVQFFIALNIQPPHIQERYKRGIGVTPCRLNLYADITTERDTKPIRHKIAIDATQDEADTIAMLYQLDGMRGLETETHAVISEWLQKYIAERNAITE